MLLGPHSINHQHNHKLPPYPVHTCALEPWLPPCLGGAAETQHCLPAESQECVLVPCRLPGLTGTWRLHILGSASSHPPVYSCRYLHVHRWSFFGFISESLFSNSSQFFVISSQLPLWTAASGRFTKSPRSGAEAVPEGLLWCHHLPLHIDDSCQFCISHCS